ncbi:AcrR family transcriptional regulator [Duganella sp. 3397]|uniref:TetR/AcrR family transcriptional regulator n=1 Tax=Duganella sp. 3397 TaxID=2817732 RepID=UPI002856E735|nr:TetR family transcriptional regulator [Duganella sp. 3397]MDR7049591.1 AcrR family transcriptional regulator [Duganella sp. 3397]
MNKKTAPRARRDYMLSRERIIDAAIDLLDREGELGLTFQALSAQLATGPGAIYGHIANKADLLTAACDAIVARAVASPSDDATPQAAIRALALALFDAMDDHPWAGATLIQAGGQMPVVRILERVGQQVSALGVPQVAHWAGASAVVNYILGVSGQNAANAQLARSQKADRDTFLAEVAIAWTRLDPAQYPFTRSVAGQLRGHDDREDFLAGVDLLLAGLVSQAQIS